MQRKFLLLLAMCALATALPRDKRSVETDSESDCDESGEAISTTTEKPTKIISIKDAADLDTRISQAGDKVVIIFFMTTWCPYSQMVKDTIEDVAAKTENLIVLKVDRDDLKKDDIAWKYGLSKLPRVPRFIFIKNGKTVKVITGASADIRGTLSKAMSPNDNNIIDSSA